MIPKKLLINKCSGVVVTVLFRLKIWAINTYGLMAFSGFLLYSPFVLAEVSVEIDPDTNLKSWILSDKGLELKIAQMLPEQVHAFYLARGFSSTIASDIAANCMMQTVVKNTTSKETGKAITILLKEWQIKQQRKSDDKAEHYSGIKLKETWNKEWEEDDISNAARVAFRWATFPTEQTFEPSGDYNWGMTSFGMAAGNTFDLNVIWHQGGHQFNTWIHTISCAKGQ